MDNEETLEPIEYRAELVNRTHGQRIHLIPKATRYCKVCHRWFAPFAIFWSFFDGICIFCYEDGARENYHD